jgi:hypothetical protein
VHAELNPFTFGALALGEGFTDRSRELRELAADMRNGQDVALYAPRRYGKSSLALHATKTVARRGVLVGYVDLMRTPTKERFAAALARTVHADLDTTADRVLERAAALFRGLRVTPTMEVDPHDASVRFVFEAGRRKADLDDTIERLLELPGEIAAQRKRRVVLVFDEFQEIVSLDKRFPNLLRAVFQTQPEVGHVYLGSKRHVLERIFSDRNEPFWRSAKQMELGPIPRRDFARFLTGRFDATDKQLTAPAADRLLGITGGHPYATQELAYFTWEQVPIGHRGHPADVDSALEHVLRSEHNHFARIWDDATPPQRLLLLALADEPTRSPYGADYHARHELPPNPSLQRALEALVREELAGREEDGEYRLIEPFLAEWLLREAS